MRIAHWTPRYVVDRLAWEWYQRRHPERPWLTPRSADLLTGLLLPTDDGVEWGSGRSTAWFAGRLRHLVSIEDNPQWHRTVTELLARRGITNVTYHAAPPPGDGEAARESLYVTLGSSCADGSLGFALVDGSAREYCAQAILPKLAPGGILVIDNCNWYLDHPTHSPSSRQNLGPANAEWAKLQETLRGWRMIWTTSGVTDTGIWIRPAASAREP